MVGGERILAVIKKCICFVSHDLLLRSMISHFKGQESIYIAVNYEKDHKLKMTEIPSSIATMKLTLATLLAVKFLITILSVHLGSPKPEFKTICILGKGDY